MKKIGEIHIKGTPDDAMALIEDIAHDMGLVVHVVDDGKEGPMAFITISGDGSIPSRSKSLTSDGTPEGHKQIFSELHDFIQEWEGATQRQDAQAELTAEKSTSTPAQPADTGGYTN